MDFELLLLEKVWQLWGLGMGCYFHWAPCWRKTSILNKLSYRLN